MEIKIELPKEEYRKVQENGKTVIYCTMRQKVFHVIGLDYHRPYTRHGKKYYRPYRNSWGGRDADLDKLVEAGLMNAYQSERTGERYWYSFNRAGLDLLSRTYGGLAWVSANTPDSGDNPDTDFPLGQVWVRPAFSVSNDAGETWTATGCTAEKSGNDVILTGLAQAATVKASQSLTGIGNQGDRVRILFTVKDMDSEMSSLTAAVNGTTQSISGDIILNGTLSANGSLTVEIYASWPSTSLADGSVTLANYTVVNLDKIMRQMAGAREIDDWNAWLQSIIPFTNYKSPLAVFSQEKAGVWTQIAFDVLPVSRGGTGLSALVPNRYLRTQADGSVGMMSPEDMAEDISALRMMTGSYTGTGEDRSITLPVTPKLLHIYAEDGPFKDTNYPNATICDNPVTLSNGGRKMEVWTYSNSSDYSLVCPYVSLSGNTITFGRSGTYASNAPTSYCNSSGKTYKWTAIY